MSEGVPGAPPIVCTLSAPELRQRRDGLLRRVRRQVAEVRAAAAEPAVAAPPGRAPGSAAAAGWEGFVLRFGGGGEATLEDLLELVRLESRCCAFLRFRLTIEPAGAGIELEIGGPAGGARLLLHEMDLDPPSG